jgi:multiple sugar transport system ATP-binding protein
MADVAIEGLCKGFDHPVLDRLDLEVAEGEFFAVVGPSGIGKTTLLRCIAGLEAPDAGRVFIGGADMTETPPYRRGVAMTFENYALYPHLSVFENIASPLRARRAGPATIRERVEAVARLLRIEELLERKPGEISGGQKQRTALGRTLVAEPDVFLLDEPISHLDAKIRHELRQEFHNLQALRRVACIYVTHDYTEALSLGDRIGVLGGGTLVQTGTPEEVFEHPNSLFVARHLGNPAINALTCRLKTHGGMLYAECEGTRFSFPVAPRHTGTLRSAGSDTVIAGIRPQFIAVLEEGAPGDDRPMVDADVEMFEPLGSTGVLIVKAAGALMTVLTGPDDAYPPGARVRLVLDTPNFHYFDAASGVSLLL